MSSDDNMRASVPAFAARGIGHIPGWQCGACNRPQYQTLGRRKRKARGLMTWVCAACVRTKDAQAVEA
jgi:hypothetical protein